MSNRPPQRIIQRFDQLKTEDRAGLVTFVTAGDPGFDASLEILRGLPAAGADLIELGMPFSDPMADGPSIQASSLRALEAGANMHKTLEMVRRFRENDAETPIILMGYYNPIYVYGPEDFSRDAALAGADGLIVVDLPPEEAAELLEPASKAGLSIIYLTTPTTDDARLPKVLEHASGFVYYVSIAGITGTASASVAHVDQAVRRIRGQTELPIAVGFGIKTPDQAAEVARVADAVVVGSALVDKVVENLNGSGPGRNLTQAVLGLVGDLSEGVRQARKGTA